MLRIIFVLIASLIISSGLYFFSDKLTGISPRIRLAEYQDKFKKWEAASNGTGEQAIKDSIIEIEETLKVKPEQNLIFLYISSLKNLININPNSSEAMLKLADLSFDKQLFDVAEAYYQEYLKLQPEDLIVQAKLASSLTFQNKLLEGEELLRKIIKKNPDDFKNLTFLAINLMQQERKKEAVELIQKAINLAQDEKVKEKLGGFLRKLQTPEWIVALANNLSANPMVGSKLLDIQVEENKLKLYLSDFPMQAMPDIARNKFLANIKSQVDKKIKIIEFLDASDKNVMYTETVTK